MRDYIGQVGCYNRPSAKRINGKSVVATDLTWFFVYNISMNGGLQLTGLLNLYVMNCVKNQE